MSVEPERYDETSLEAWTRAIANSRREYDRSLCGVCGVVLTGTDRSHGIRTCPDHRGTLR